MLLRYFTLISNDLLSTFFSFFFFVDFSFQDFFYFIFKTIFSSSLNKFLNISFNNNNLIASELERNSKILWFSYFSFFSKRWSPINHKHYCRHHDYYHCNHLHHNHQHYYYGHYFLLVLFCFCCYLQCLEIDS